LIPSKKALAPQARRQEIQTDRIANSFLAYLGDAGFLPL